MRSKRIPHLARIARPLVGKGPESLIEDLGPLPIPKFSNRTSSLRSPVLGFRSVSFGVYRRTYKPRLYKGRGHTLIVPLQLPARPRLHQLLEESYLFVSGDLALFVSDKLVHQSH